MKRKRQRRTVGCEKGKEQESTGGLTWNERKRDKRSGLRRVGSGAKEEREKKRRVVVVVAR